MEAFNERLLPPHGLGRGDAVPRQCGEGKQARACLGNP